MDKKHFKCIMEKNSRITINVSGQIFETYENTLNRFPTTLLGNSKKRQQYFCPRRKQIFLNRHRSAFEAILFFYQSDGQLSRPPSIARNIFEEECSFYQIPEICMRNMKIKGGEIIQIPKTKIKTDLSFKEKIWYFLEKPETSTGAYIFAVFSISAVLISILIYCLETMPQLQLVGGKDLTNFWFWMEFGLYCWFLFEFLARLLSCRAKAKFFKNTLNIVDILAIFPYFILCGLNVNNIRTIGFLKILRLLRVFRLFRLSRHCHRLKIIGLIVADSLRDLQLFLVCLLIIVTFGGSLMYYLEQGNPETLFVHIPESIYWAIQTLVTVGYGDILPATVYGKCFSTLFMVFGALTISLPVMSLVMKFTSQYTLDGKLSFE